MSILVVGSVAFDSIKTPFGVAEDVLGGSASYFSTSASFFTDVNLVAVVGDDFPQEHVDFLQSRKVDLAGLQRTQGETFRWKGRYDYNLNEAHTLETHLNVFESFKPVLPDNYCDAEYVFLANIDPELQLEVLQQVRHPKLVACDTMNFWIEGKKAQLIKTLSRVDILLINEAEVRQLADEPNLLKAAEIVRSFGPKTLVVKRGEYGVLMFGEGSIFSAPAYPLEEVFDPTGAGDTFAGGFVGYLAATRNLEEHNLRKATVFGTVMASFTVEKFSLDRLREIEYSEIVDRYKKIKVLTEFADID
ncbi:Sugar or nucleoside kinase, ribokinase family [Desulfuromusa kysingii]|uniref:Sugar or nucleoside kinase, ribokinase family n=1 Tax=Desulfuromusa kysingii TaxID=37625 RepID=A0A1H4BF51_9BACT|nr:PfkB family carbohydrate kinase [Desulfuromusa kysingii]SEA46791.1 Sugar or nucleoside kinase, ribokinase family [Desulfuromusa kysingii]